jgi:hypothetical protein
MWSGGRFAMRSEGGGLSKGSKKGGLCWREDTGWEDVDSAFGEYAFGVEVEAVAGEVVVVVVVFAEEEGVDVGLDVGVFMLGVVIAGVAVAGTGGKGALGLLARAGEKRSWNCEHTRNSSC